MNTKKAIIVALFALATAPLATQAEASGPTAAFDACVKAFVSSYLPNHPVKQTKTISPPGHSTIALLQPRKYTIALSARGANSGELLAEARCISDRQGIVLILDSPPPATYIASADFIATLR